MTHAGVTTDSQTPCLISICVRAYPASTQTAIASAASVPMLLTVNRCRLSVPMMLPTPMPESAAQIAFMITKAVACPVEIIMFKLLLRR